MYGLAIEKLKEWKNKEDRKSIILMGGARQVGLGSWKNLAKTNMRKSHIYHFIVQSKNTRDFSHEMN